MNNKERKVATSKVQIDNSSIRVTEYIFSPGAETKTHKHIWDYIVLPMTDGNLMLLSEGKLKEKSKLVVGQSYFRKAGIEHNVINNSKKDLVFIEIEIKSQATK